MIEQIGWNAVVSPAGSKEHVPVASGSRSISTLTPTSSAMISRPTDGAEVQKAREAFTSLVLQSFLEAAIPKNLSGIGQSGAANTMWRSLLVEQLAKTIAASGQIDVLGGAEDNQIVGTTNLPPTPTGQLINRKEKANE